jgi:hypothetical protein
MFWRNSIPDVLYNALVHLTTNTSRLVNRITSRKLSKTIHEEVHEINLMMREKRRVKISSL